MNLREQKWATYFDELDYEILYKPQKYTLGGDKSYNPTFYLADQLCYAEVINGELTTEKHEMMRQLAMESSIPIVLLDTNPDFKFYEMLEFEKGEIEISHVNIIKDGILKNRFLTGHDKFKQSGYKAEIKAVQTANK